MLERRVFRHLALGRGFLRNHHIDAAAPKDTAYTEQLPVLQIESVEVVRGSSNKLDLFRHQRLHVRAVTTGYDDFEVDSRLFEKVASTTDINRHVA